MKKKRPVYPMVDLSGMDEKSAKEIVDALVEEEKKRDSVYVCLPVEEGKQRGESVMEKKELNGKVYWHMPTNAQCPLITIKGKVFCVMKDCYVRALLHAENWDCHTLPRDGNQIIEEAPKGWEKQCDLYVESGRAKPEYWI